MRRAVIQQSSFHQLKGFEGFITAEAGIYFDGHLSLEKKKTRFRFVRLPEEVNITFLNLLLSVIHPQQLLLKNCHHE